MNLHKIEEFHDLIEGELTSQTINIFICCASFEERCKSLPVKISPKKIKYALICEHEEVEEFVAKNSKDLHKHFGKKAISVKLSLSNPLKTIDSLIQAIETSNNSKPITFFVDITTFTHESLLILLRLLNFFGKSKDTIKFLYATASNYSANSENQLDSPDNGTENDDQQVNLRWLSKGIKEIRSVMGFPGVLLPSRKLHLIVLAGYEEERATKIIDNYEASFVSIGIGAKNESINPKLYKINEAFHKRLCGFYQNVENFSFSLTNPENTKENIQSQINKHPECNTIIAPLNTKISTIGAALAALENNEIQLSYAQVNYYNVENYSKPGDEFYLFDLPALPTQKKDSKS